MAQSHAPVPSVKFFQQYVTELISLKWSVENVPTEEASRFPAPAPAGPQNPAVKPAETPKADETAADSNSQESAPSTGEALTPGRPAIIWNRLAGMLEQQFLEASRLAGPLGVEFHREAVYVMAALTDEIFVHLGWEGREYWLAHLFESRFFNSHFAGQRFFTRIDGLLMRDDDAAAEIATLYLMALALGFRGRYFGSARQAVVDSYRSRLFFFVTRRDPDIGEATKRLFPPTYRFTIQAGAPRRLPNPRRWLLALGGAVIVWILIAQSLWSALSGDLNRKVCCLTPECKLSCVAQPAARDNH